MRECEKNMPWPTLKYYPNIFADGNEEKQEISIRRAGLRAEI
jgi:hypothetical protein